MEEKDIHVHNFLTTKSLLTILLMIIWCYQLNGQSKLPPHFTGNCLGVAATDNLFKCLNNIPDSVRKKLFPCAYGVGIFTFRVSNTGSIGNITFEGNLPSELITHIKANIQETAGRWESTMVNGKPVDNLPFIFMFCVDIDVTTNMECSDKNRSSRESVLLGFSLKKYLHLSLMNVSQVIVTDEGYILPVGSLAILR